MQTLNPTQLDNLLARLTTFEQIDEWEERRRDLAGNPLARLLVAQKARAARSALATPRPAPPPHAPAGHDAGPTDEERRWAEALAACLTVEDLLDVLAKMANQPGARYAAVTAAEQIVASGTPQHRRELRRLAREDLQLEADLIALHLLRD